MPEAVMRRAHFVSARRDLPERETAVGRARHDRIAFVVQIVNRDFHAGNRCPLESFAVPWIALNDV
jgi:hypothetical protein